MDLLEDIGENLSDLDLYAVDQLDMKALAMISIYCKKLSKVFIFLKMMYSKFLFLLVNLGFSQCGFSPTVDEMFLENGEDRGLRPTQRDELPVEQLVQNFEYLQSLKLTSQCSKDYARY